MSTSLTWESSYAIAKALHSMHPEISLEEVSFNQLYRWTIALPEFKDDLSLCNDDILAAIYQEWYEEIIHE